MENSMGPTRSAGVVSSTGRMKSFCGSGLYCSTSIGPRVSVTCSRALAMDAGSRTSAAKPLACTPSLASSSASASSRPWWREMRPTVRPSAPKRRATAAPSPAPAPMIAMEVMSGSKHDGAEVFHRLVPGPPSVPGFQSDCLAQLLHCLLECGFIGCSRLHQCGERLSDDVEFLLGGFLGAAAGVLEEDHQQQGDHTADGVNSHLPRLEVCPERNADEPGNDDAGAHEEEGSLANPSVRNLDEPIERRSVVGALATLFSVSSIHGESLPIAPRER